MKLDTKDLLEGMEEDITLDYVSNMFRYIDDNTRKEIIRSMEDYFTPVTQEVFLTDAVSSVKARKDIYVAMAERRKQTVT